MTIDGDVLEIELDMEIDDVLELKNFMEPRLKYIEEISVVGEKNEFASSALFQLLFSVKRIKPSIKIPIIDDGFFELGKYGKIYWIRS